ncbi:phage holin [Bacillus sp. FJAT-53060]|uniref:phage holin n=1 Tax=Bacillus TaxID=1386 RepID=UPI001CF94782|nr:phage holin [Bacillus stratosphericus]
MKTNISAGTVARFILLALALVNSGLTMFGVQTISVDEAAVSDFIALLFLGATSLWAYWKNNDVTKKARERKALHEVGK